MAGEAAARDYTFSGPEVRRLSAEQFADAIGAITGEWNVYPGRPATPGSSAFGRPRASTWTLCSPAIPRK